MNELREQMINILESGTASEHYELSKLYKIVLYALNNTTFTELTEPIQLVYGENTLVNYMGDITYVSKKFLDEFDIRTQLYFIVHEVYLTHCKYTSIVDFCPIIDNYWSEELYNEIEDRLPKMTISKYHSILISIVKDNSLLGDYGVRLIYGDIGEYTIARKLINEDYDGDEFIIGAYNIQLIDIAQNKVLKTRSKEAEAFYSDTIAIRALAGLK